MAVVRYRPDGTLDRTFSDDGKAITSFASGPADVELNRARAHALDLRGHGRIVTAGRGLNEACDQVGASAGILTRYRGNGHLDSAFGDGGRAVPVRTTAAACWCEWKDVAIDTDGRLVLTGDARGDVGNTEVAVARTKPDGTLDGGFGLGGWVLLSLTGAQQEVGFGVALQKDRPILVAGTDGSTFSEDGPAFFVARFLP